MCHEKIPQRLRQTEDGQKPSARRPGEEAAQRLLFGTRLGQAREQEEALVRAGGVGEGFDGRRIDSVLRALVKEPSGLGGVGEARFAQTRGDGSFAHGGQQVGRKRVRSNGVTWRW